MPPGGGSFYCYSQKIHLFLTSNYNRMRLLSKFILKITGWKTFGDIPPEVTKAVFIIAPHTSNLDFFIGRMYCFMRRIPIKVMIKKESFAGPLGGLLKKAGGVPIDRSKSTSLVDQIVQMFNENDPFFFAITPEGTRKKSEKWKSGFYHIAVKANVPILLSYIDYGKKVAGIGRVFYPTGDFKKDFKEIEDFYRGRQGRHSGKFNL